MNNKEEEESHLHHHSTTSKRPRPASSSSSSSSSPCTAPTVRGLLCYAIVASLHYTYYWTNTILLNTTPSSASSSSASSPTTATLHDPNDPSSRFHLAPLPSSSSSTHHATDNHHNHYNLTQKSAAAVQGRHAPRRQHARLPSLDDLTRTDTTTTPVAACPKGLVRLENRVAAAAAPTAPSQHQPATKRSQSSGFLSPRTHDRYHYHRIPHIVHQTSKTRCVTPAFAAAAAQWHFSDNADGHHNKDWSYYLHDDVAVRKLLYDNVVASEFPHLAPIAEHCLLHGTLASDLWRYVLLWTYGGVYADLDTVPNALNLPHYLAYDDDSDKDDNGDPRLQQPRITNGNHSHGHNNYTALHPDSPPDALFVIEQFHLLSQYFMAVSPRHPLMWYAIHHTLVHLSLQLDTGSIPAALVTGPHALHRAFTSFRADVGVTVDPAIGGYKPVQAGTYIGTHNRTITALGQAEHQNVYIQRDVIGPTKKLHYQRMAMRHFQDDKKHPTGQSCASALLEGYYRNVADLGAEEGTAE